MEKQEPYRVQSHTFKGSDEHNGKIWSYTYEISLNRSMVHTGRFQGMEDGLNRYVSEESMSSWKRRWNGLIDGFKFK
jgi:hypothetical protein